MYHKYLWEAHGAILPDYSYLLNWVKCNAIPKTAFRMKGKAQKAREIIAAIWVTENAKQRSTIPFCVVCVRCVCIVLFCFVLFVDVSKHVNIPWYVLYRDKNQPKSCTGRTKHTLRSGQWHVYSRNISFRREGFLSGFFSLHLANTHPRVVIVTSCQDSDAHLPFIWSCQSIFVHINQSWFEKNLGSKISCMNP